MRWVSRGTRAWGVVSSLCLLLFTTACAAATYDTHDDLTISTQVKIALIDDARLGEFRINATTTRGVVTLEGSVPLPTDVEHAIAVARKVRGVKDVKSALKTGSSQ
jgi:osmotically-inducible protein OsmY